MHSGFSVSGPHLSAQPETELDMSAGRGFSLRNCAS